ISGHPITWPTSSQSLLPSSIALIDWFAAKRLRPGGSLRHRELGQNNGSDRTGLPVETTAERQKSLPRQSGAPSEPMKDSLNGKVAVVAGATRGAGRGIATGLGEAGATVICTGRSSIHGNAASDYDRPETIEETAQIVTEFGGNGVAIQVDHLDADQLHRLALRLRNDYGRIDILVNDIWGAEILKGPPHQWNTPIWEHDLAAGLRILRLGLDTHLMTSHRLLPLVIRRPGGLLVEITDGTTEYNADHYRISVFYDLVK